MHPPKLKFSHLVKFDCRFVYVVQQLYMQLASENKCILVHCTHGYNRTGFMVVSYWLRNHDSFPYLSVKEWIDQFAKVRAPGIYKPEYVTELFKRANEIKYATP